MKIDIRQANAADKDGIWKVLSAAVEDGNSCVYSYDMSYDDIINDWFKWNRQVFVAENEEQEIVGTFHISPLDTGLASHVVVADFLVFSNYKGRNVLRVMVQSALDTAKSQGFVAMYLKVVQHHKDEMRVYNQLNFHVTGSIPRAYRNSQGRFSAFVMMIRTI
jgi:L-amino acid N-acyltransferase YncA